MLTMWNSAELFRPGVACQPTELREQALLFRSLLDCLLTWTKELNDDLQTKLQQIFREVFDDDALLLDHGLSPETLAAWDSLGHIRLIAALEDELHLTFTLEEIEVMNTAEAIGKIVAAKS